MSIADKISSYKEHDSQHVRNRATIILMTLEGNSSEKIADKLGLSSGTVKKWQAAWEKDGMSIFPPLEDNLSTDEEAETSNTNEAASGKHSQDNSGELMVMEAIENEDTQVSEEQWLFPEIAAMDVTHSLLEAGRLTMLKQLKTLLEQEAVFMSDKSVSSVHQMRIAIRRWRSVYDSFGDYLPKAYHRAMYAQLKHTAKQLGEVRDLDVFLIKTRSYIKTELEGEHAALESLIRMVKKDRRQARRQLAHWLESKTFKRFVKRSFKLLTEDIADETLIRKSGDFTSARLDHVLPVTIYQRFEAVRRYEELLPDAPIKILHSLRKDCKRLRYILELHADVLGDEVQSVIDTTKVVQEHLGDLYDAKVAVNIIRASEKHSKKSDKAALKSYRQYRQAEIETLRASFPEVWSRFNQASIRRALAQSLAVL